MVPLHLAALATALAEPVMMAADNWAPELWASSAVDPAGHCECCRDTVGLGQLVLAECVAFETVAALAECVGAVGGFPSARAREIAGQTRR